MRYRQFGLLAASATASLTVDGLWLVAAVWQVIALGGGPTDLSVVATATSVGIVVTVLPGGLAADRLPKRPMLVAVEVVRTVAPLVAGVLALTGALRIGHLAVMAFVLGAAVGFYYPTWSATVPRILPAGELLAANGIEGMLRPLAQQAAGPAIAGVLVAAFSPGVGLLGAGVGYLVALVPLLVLRPVPAAEPDGKAPEEQPSVRRQLVKGFGYLFGTGWLFATLAFAVLTVLVVEGPFEVLLPFAVRDRVGAGPAGLSAVLVSYGVGSAGGALGVCSWRRPRRYLPGIPTTFVVAAVVPSALALVALLAWRLPRDEIAHPLDPATAPSAPRSPP